MNWFGLWGTVYETSAIGGLHDLLHTFVATTLIASFGVAGLLAALRSIREGDDRARVWALRGPVRLSLVAGCVGALLTLASWSILSAARLTASYDGWSNTATYDRFLRRGAPIYFDESFAQWDAPPYKRELAMSRMAIDLLFWSGLAAIGIARRRMRHGTTRPGFATEVPAAIAVRRPLRSRRARR